MWVGMEVPHLLGALDGRIQLNGPWKIVPQKGEKRNRVVVCSNAPFWELNQEGVAS